MESHKGLVLAATAALAGLAYVLAPRRVPTPRREASPGRELSLLSANAYLIPWFFVYKEVLQGNKFAIDSCKDQHKRAGLLAEVCKTHDVLALQEIWGGATDVLQREIEKTHQILPIYRGWLGVFGTGLLADYVNSVKAHLRKAGGIWFASCPASTSVIWSYHHTFVHNRGEEVMNKSVVFVLLDVSRKWGPGRTLLIANTHLHSPEPFAHTEDRRLQRQELLEILRGLPNRLSEQGIHVDWNKCGGLLVGDLNTAQSSKGDLTGSTPTPEYRETLQVFDAVDLYFENDSFEEAEKGILSFDGNRNPHVAPGSKKDSARLDYILELRSLGSIPLMRLRAKSCKILSELEQEVSDHYPLSLVITPRD